MSYQIFWSEEAIANLEQIINYLSEKWTEREVNNFKLRLVEQIEIIAKFPFGFPVSAQISRLRKAVLTKHTSIFYEVREQNIYLAYIFDTRQNPEKVS